MEDMDVCNGMVFVDVNDEETAEVAASCSIADLERNHHHLNCLRAKGVCRALSHALAGAFILWSEKYLFVFSFKLNFTS